MEPAAVVWAAMGNPDLFQDIGRKGGGFLGGHVHVHHDVFGDAGQPAFAGVEHLLDIVQALGVIVEKLRGDPHPVPAWSSRR